jgi:hypothetical protein
VSKYKLPSQHFRDLSGQAWHATFEDIEKILGFSLPNSARAHQAWWANSTDQMPQKRAWPDAGWRTRDLNLASAEVIQRSDTLGKPRIWPDDLGTTGIPAQVSKPISG